MSTTPTPTKTPLVVDTYKQAVGEALTKIKAHIDGHMSGIVARVEIRKGALAEDAPDLPGRFRTVAGPDRVYIDTDLCAAMVTFMAVKAPHKEMFHLKPGGERRLVMSHHSV